MAPTTMVVRLVLLSQVRDLATAVPHLPEPCIFVGGVHLTYKLCDFKLLEPGRGKMMGWRAGNGFCLQLLKVLCPSFAHLCS